MTVAVGVTLDMWYYIDAYRVRKDGDTTEGKIMSACGNIVLAIEEHDSGDGNTAPVSATDKAESKEKFNFDVFISYSHKNPAHAEKLLESFNKLDPSFKVFYDRSALTTGNISKDFSHSAPNLALLALYFSDSVPNLVLLALTLFCLSWHPI